MPEEHSQAPPTDGLRLQPMIHVEDMAASVAFYERLGGEVRHGSRDGDWVLLDLAGSEISLLAHPPNPEQDEGAVELNLESRGALEELEAFLTAAGLVITEPTTDTGFGKQLQIRSPDGLLLKINQMDADV